MRLLGHMARAPQSARGEHSPSAPAAMPPWCPTTPRGVAAVARSASGGACGVCGLHVWAARRGDDSYVGQESFRNAGCAKSWNAGLRCRHPWRAGDTENQAPRQLPKSCSQRVPKSSPETPANSGIAQQLSQSGRTFGLGAENRPKFDQTWPIQAAMWSMWAKHFQYAQLWSIWAHFGRCLSNPVKSGQIRSIFSGCGLISVNFGRT